MINSALYVALYIFEILLLGGVIVYICALIYSALRGSPYVTTKKFLVDAILKEMNLKKGQTFLELGCGDGRILRRASLLYGVKGLGIDINPIVIWWAKVKSLKHNDLPIEFKVGDLHQTSVAGYDIVYLFLMPELLAKLGPRFVKEANRGTLFVSHGFLIEGWKKYHIHTLEMKPFNTYYYRIPSKK